MMTREERSDKITKEWEEQEEKKEAKKRFFRRLKRILFLLIILIGSYCYMRFVATSGIFVREYRIIDSSLPPSFHGIKIVHFSDMHYQSTFGEKDLSQLISKIQDLEPDILIFTGDLTDSKTNITQDDLKTIIASFQKLSAPLGMYAVRGNDDYDGSNFDVVFTNTNFKILDNNYELIYSKSTTPILLVGLGSSLKDDLNLESAYHLIETENYYTISLFHEPDTITKVLDKYTTSLAFSGHSHNGQIRLPKLGAVFSKEGAKKYPNPYYEIGSTKLYVSGGLGTSHYPLRLFNHPSINLYRLVTH